MARITSDEMQSAYEKEIRATNELLSDMQHIKNMEGQGSGGTSTTYTDAKRLEESREKKWSILLNIYRSQDIK